MPQQNFDNFLLLVGKYVIFAHIMKKYLIGASVPIILYMLYVFVSPTWLAYRYSLRERNYQEWKVWATNPATGYTPAIQLLLEDKPKYEKIFRGFAHSSDNWGYQRQTLSLVSKGKGKETLKSMKDEGHREVPHNILERKTAQKIHLRLWNKRSRAKDLLAEVISSIDIGSFAIGKDTFWLPANQMTHVKLLDGNTWDSKGMSIDNMFSFHTKVLDDNSLETTVHLEYNFSSQQNYTVYTQLSGNKYIEGAIQFWAFGFKIVSKHNQYEITEDEVFGKLIKENKYQYSVKDLKRFGLKNLNLDMFEVGTIEIEVVK